MTAATDRTISASTAGGAAARTKLSLSKTRRADLDAARGLAIMLVVLGHLIARANAWPPGYEEAILAKSVIYDFHMPLFLYLSGLTFFLSRQIDTFPHGYLHYVRERAFRLLVPFVVFGLVITVGKMLAQHVMFVDQPPSSLMQGIAALFVGSNESPAFSIWYMWVLFVYSALTPIFWRTANVVLFAIIPIALIAPIFIDTTEVFYIDLIVRFAGFFLLGGLSAFLFPESLRLKPVWLLLAFIGFAGALAVARPLHADVRLVICGLASVPAIHAFASFREWKQTDVLVWLGRNSFVIYLLNTVFIGLTKGVILRVAPNLMEVAPIMLSLLFAAGLLGPICLRLVAFKRWQPLYQLTR